MREVVIKGEYHVEVPDAAGCNYTVEPIICPLPLGPTDPDNPDLFVFETADGLMSLTADAIENMGGLDKAQKIVESGKWEVVQNGVTKLWELKYPGNEHINGGIVALERAYIADAARGAAILKVAKGVGVVANVAGIGLTLYDIGTDNDGKVINGEQSMDLIMGGVAFVPVYGWVISGGYFLTKPVIFAPIQSGINDYNQAHPPFQQGQEIFHICFSMGTEISTPNGFVAIEKIAIGDSIWTYNFAKDTTIEVGVVSSIIQGMSKEIYTIGTSDQEILVTENHPFYVKSKGWIQVKNLTLGDTLLSADGKEEVVISLKVKLSQQKVFNIEVGGNHNYFITRSRILVHNKKVVEPPIENSPK